MRPYYFFIGFVGFVTLPPRFVAFSIVLIAFVDFPRLGQKPHSTASRECAGLESAKTIHQSSLFCYFLTLFVQLSEVHSERFVLLSWKTLYFQEMHVLFMDIGKLSV